jgi:ADP-heptose:LPS heptosyltransferase
VGFGDEIIATGMARDAAKRGKRIAFGNGSSIIWSHNCEPVFRYNPNIAHPGEEKVWVTREKLEWIHHYKHHRLYMHPSTNGRWVYNRDFKIQPGELFFSPDERDFANQVRRGFVLIEPNAKLCYPNKVWPFERYAAVATELARSGHTVCQLMYAGTGPLPYVKTIYTPTIRHAFAALSRATVFVGCEGAMTHAAAALGVNAVVLFGGFTDPYVLGYPNNVNLTGGAEPCGMVASCAHCAAAMRAISVDEVCSSIHGLL